MGLEQGIAYYNLHNQEGYKKAIQELNQHFSVNDFDNYLTSILSRYYSALAYKKLGKDQHEQMHFQLIISRLRQRPAGLNLTAIEEYLLLKVKASSHFFLANAQANSHEDAINEFCEAHTAFAQVLSSSLDIAIGSNRIALEDTLYHAMVSALMVDQPFNCAEKIAGIADIVLKIQTCCRFAARLRLESAIPKITVGKKDSLVIAENIIFSSSFNAIKALAETRPIAPDILQQMTEIFSDYIIVLQKQAEPLLPNLETWLEAITGLQEPALIMQLINRWVQNLIEKISVSQAERHIICDLLENNLQRYQSLSKEKSTNPACQLEYLQTQLHYARYGFWDDNYDTHAAAIAARCNEVIQISRQHLSHPQYSQYHFEANYLTALLKLKNSQPVSQYLLADPANRDNSGLFDTYMRVIKDCYRLGKHKKALKYVDQLLENVEALTNLRCVTNRTAIIKRIKEKVSSSIELRYYNPLICRKRYGVTSATPRDASDAIAFASIFRLEETINFLRQNSNYQNAHLTTGEFYVAIGECHQFLGDTTSALRDYEQAINYDRDNGNYFSHRRFFRAMLTLQFPEYQRDMERIKSDLTSAATNTKTSLSQKLYSYVQLRKYFGDNKNLQPMLKELMDVPEKTEEELTVIALTAHHVGDHNLVHSTITRLITTYNLTDIPSYYYHDFVQLLSTAAATLELRKDAVANKREFQDNLLVLISYLQPEVKANTLAQALIPNTWLNKLLSRKNSFSFTSPIDLVKKQLLEMKTVSLNDETKAALSNNWETLKASLGKELLTKLESFITPIFSANYVAPAAAVPAVAALPQQANALYLSMKKNILTGHQSDAQPQIELPPTGPEETKPPKADDIAPHK